MLYRSNKKEVEKRAKEILLETNFSFDKNEDFKIKIETDFSFNGRKTVAWLVGIPFGKEDYGRNKLAFLLIADETLNPIYLQHNMSAFIYYKTKEDGSILTSSKPFDELST